MIFRREVLNQWLLGVILHFLLFQITGELKEKNAVLPQANLRQDIVPENGPAKRMVFVVVEGLRWDVFLNKGNISGFPRLIPGRGTIGSIYVKFPSTTYRGLLRMATGVPESGSNNTVNIFHLTRTVYIGPPSVRRVFTNFNESYSYPEVWEDLVVSPNETKGDEWVFTKWDQLLATSFKKSNNTTLFFIYLSGLEIASQLDGPLSYRTIKEMKYIFDSLGMLYLKTEKFFNDGMTTYILTSDRGFTGNTVNKESYLNETMVPFLTWGAGLAKTSEITETDSSRLNRKGYVRHEDLTPLISYLLGTDIPPNSFGSAPLIRLSKTEDRAKMALLNAKQLAALFQSFEKAYGFGIARFCAPLNSPLIDTYFSEIDHSFTKNDYHLSISKCQDLIELSLEGISFYRNYETNILWICAVISLIGWTTVTLGWILEKVKISPIIQREMVSERQEDSEQPTVKNLTVFQRFLTPLFLINTIWFLVFCCTIGLLIFISAPLIVSLASILAITMSWLAAECSLDWIRLYKSLTFHDLKIKKGKPLMHLCYFLVFSCCLSYPILVQVLFSFAIMFSALSDLRYSTGSHLAYWMLSSLSYLILPHYTFNTPYLPVLIIAAMIWIVGGGIFLHCLKVRYTDWPIFMVAFFSIALISIHSQYGPPTTDQNLILRWTPMILIFFIPLIGSPSLPVRLFQISLCLSVSVFLLSLSFEPISLLVILSHVFSWALLEGYSNVSVFFSSTLHFSEETSSIIWTDVRRSFYFMAYILTSFLVIGNSCDIYNWSNEWSSYFGPSSAINVYVLVCLKSIPIILVDNIFFAILEKSSAIGYQSIILHIASQTSLINFILISESPITLYNQLMFFFSLLMKPVAYLFLTPSIFSVLIGPVIPNTRQGRSPEIRPMTAETSL